jgi:hypothetical protein
MIRRHFIARVPSAAESRPGQFSPSARGDTLRTFGDFLGTVDIPERKCYSPRPHGVVLSKHLNKDAAVRNEFTSECKGY